MKKIKLVGVTLALFCTLSMAAVSYTHLDVYKRQLFTRTVTAVISSPARSMILQQKMCIRDRVHNEESQS